jgi:hypothetical protein
MAVATGSESRTHLQEATEYSVERAPGWASFADD